MLSFFLLYSRWRTTAASAHRQEGEVRLRAVLTNPFFPQCETVRSHRMKAQCQSARSPVHTGECSQVIRADGRIAVWIDRSVVIRRGLPAFPVFGAREPSLTYQLRDRGADTFEQRSPVCALQHEPRHLIAGCHPDTSLLVPKQEDLVPTNRHSFANFFSAVMCRHWAPLPAHSRPPDPPKGRYRARR